ncbi:MAG: DNA alkylation repair protein [Bryobacteraceae bacterium]|jgi:3-methyladenine DNA glycosylase AlkD
MTKTNDILKRLRAAGSAVNVAGMARYGIRPAKAYGVATPVMRSIAKELGRDTELAAALWSTNVLEARMLATMIADPLQIPEAEVERWVRGFDCWSVCDSACICLLWKTPFAWRKVREWSRRKPEYERRAAFALLAGLAVHDKQAPDKRFRAALRLIAKAATDDRNFVKKAVNWALRQIGKRNPALREAAIATAESLAGAESRSARWIGRDALRELRRKN